MAAKKRPPRDIAWVQKLPNDFLQCRTLRHMWDITSFEYVDDYRGKRRDLTATVVRRLLMCRRCDTTREDFFEMKGTRFTKLGSRYTYQFGYKFVHDEHEADRPNSEDFNRVLYERYWSIRERKKA